MKHPEVSLDDKYRPGLERVYLTGTQALVRLPLLQRQRDLAAGLNTAGYVSGYRGSPLGQVDIQMWAARAHLEASHIVFRAGVNEELAATAIWGTQQVPLLRGARYDGVFAFWYGKGPGVDRAGDVFKHANYAGSAPGGGVLLIAGDDHACKSSTIPHQSELAFVSAACPVLVPADVRDLLELGLHGWAMSRWSGRYVGFKTVADVMDSSASIAFDLAAFTVTSPEGPRPDGNIRLPDPALEQEARVFRVGLPAAQAYARANRLDRIVADPPGARFGIVTVGKSYHDTRQALAELGLGEGARAGIRVLKLALAWPVDPQIVRHFAAGLDEIVVVEEKAPLVEQQLRDILYAQTVRPRILGKTDEAGAPLLKRHGDLSAAEIALALARRIGRFARSETLAARVDFLTEQAARLERTEVAAQRKPFFCSGCPHNTSTRVIDGSRALGGIGCHTLAVWMDRSTDTFSQMGGEGMAWLGQAPFTEETHVFANMGDGTYYHSGLMAIRAAAASGENITYKLLFNDAVAMTGGQHVDGNLTVPLLTRQLAAEGVEHIVVVTDEPEKHEGETGFAPGVSVHHRREMQDIERALRETPGCTVLIYDQTCASEKRRRRKRGTYPDPAVRAFINAAVCEDCGDCSRASNCLSVVPVETEFGTRRRIDQSSCNRDFSCIEGFCPSFVTVHGAAPLPRARVVPETGGLPHPALPELDRPWNILVTGIGGTGIVTVGALLGMAAHSEGKLVTVLDQMGMAQKGGAVTSHIRVGAADAPQGALHGLKVGRGEADLLLGCDLVVSAGRDTLAVVRRGVTQVVLNTQETPTADFVLDTDTRLPAAQLRRSICEAAGEAAVTAIDATALAGALLGDPIAANAFLLGLAWQKGLIPLALDSLMGAIALNGTAVALNQAAFTWGRCAAVAPARVAAACGVSLERPAPKSLDEIIAIRERHLVAYQSRGLAERYLSLVEWVREEEGRRFSGGTVLTEAVARGYAKLLAVKDEWEVARLFAAPSFHAALGATFGTLERLEFHLALPLFGRRDPATGQQIKRSYGGWMMPVFRLLAALRFLRNTPLDPFARTEERRRELALVAEYEATVAEILDRLSPATLPVAVALAALPERIRGFGHVRERSLRLAGAERALLLERLRAPAQAMAAE